MNLKSTRYNQYLKHWKSQFSIYAELMTSNLMLLTNLEADHLTPIAYSDPSESNTFTKQLNPYSITQSTINKLTNILVPNLQTDVKWKNSLEYMADFKCFYALIVSNADGTAFGALCMYSREVSFFDEEKINHLGKIKNLIEDDLKNISKSDIIPSIPRDTLLSDDEKFKHFFHFSPIGIFYFDTNLIITDLNNKFCEIIKSPREILLGLDINLIKDRRVIPPLKSALSGVEDEYQGEYITSTSKTNTQILLKTSPIYDSNNNITGGIGVVQDISKNIHTENALKTSELKYRDLVEKINDVIFSIDKEGICTYTSPVIKLLIGYTPEEIIGYHFMNFIHDQHKITFHDALIKVSQGSTVISEVKLKNKEGSYHWIRNSMRPVYNEEGNFTGIHGIAQDIEETRLAEISLKESEEQFRMVATHISDLIYEWDPLTDQLKWYGPPKVLSSQLENINKLSDLKKIITSSNHDKIDDLWNKAVQDKKAWKSEFVLRTGSIEPIYILGSGLMLSKNDIAFKGFGTLTNITEQKKLIKNLKDSNEQLAENITKTNGLLTVIPDMMFVFNSEGHITDFSCNQEDQLYASKDEFLNKNIINVLPSEIAILTQNKIKTVLENKKTDTYKYQLEINGKPETFESRMVYLNKNHALAIVRNITTQEIAKMELIAAKEKAEESDRLKSSFLANMSHEIRTPMNGIIGFSELLSAKTLNPEEREYYTSVIIKSGHQLLEIINDVLEISKIETGQIKVNKSLVNINELLQLLLSFFSNKAIEKNTNIKISTPLNNDDATIYSDASKLKQILNNLISNAIKFTSNGKINVGYEINNDKFIVFFIEDNGIGIATNEQLKIFERFTQANPQIARKHGGTGLGLSISQSLTELLGGKIWVDSELGKGAKFSFSIPYQTSPE
ncbi:PAS domain S-box protein [Labilibacter sediminis]|nr:PAS domain S-box protein [Labilibacter sediminis]